MSSAVLAQIHYRRAAEIEEGARGREHPDLFKTLANLADMLQEQRRYTNAEALYLRSMKIGEKSLGPAHPDVLAVMSSYAGLLRSLHRKSEARKLEAQIRESRSKLASENAQRFEVDWRDLQNRRR